MAAMEPLPTCYKDLTEAQRRRVHGCTDSWRRARMQRVYYARQLPDFEKDSWAATRCLQHELALMPRSIRARGLHLLPKNVQLRLQHFMEAGLHNEACALQVVRGRGYVMELAEELDVAELGMEAEPEHRDGSEPECRDGSESSTSGEAEAAPSFKVGIHGISYCKRDEMYRICVSLQLNIFVDTSSRSLEEAIAVHALLVEAIAACRLSDSIETLVAAVDACKRDMCSNGFQQILSFWAVAQIGRTRGARISLHSPRTLTVADAYHWRSQLQGAFAADGPECPVALSQCFQAKQYESEEAHARAERCWLTVLRLRENQRERNLQCTLRRLVPAIRTELAVERANARARQNPTRCTRKRDAAERTPVSVKRLKLGPCRKEAFKHLTIDEIMRRPS